jgi:hypothetical protein
MWRDLMLRGWGCRGRWRRWEGLAWFDEGGSRV